MNKPKLFALILKCLSKESLEAIKKGTNWGTMEVDVDLEGLWWIVKE
jgi:hypothetical protein